MTTYMPGTYSYVLIIISKDPRIPNRRYEGDVVIEDPWSHRDLVNLVYRGEQSRNHRDPALFNLSARYDAKFTRY